MASKFPVHLLPVEKLVSFFTISYTQTFSPLGTKPAAWFSIERNTLYLILQTYAWFSVLLDDDEALYGMTTDLERLRSLCWVMTSFRTMITLSW